MRSALLSALLLLLGACAQLQTKVPQDVEFDLTGLEIGDSVHISAIKLPKGVSAAIQDRDFTIATIAAPAGLKSDEAAAEGAEEEAKDGE